MTSWDGRGTYIITDPAYLAGLYGGMMKAQAAISSEVPPDALEYTRRVHGACQVSRGQPLHEISISCHRACSNYRQLQSSLLTLLDVISKHFT